jgi:hypothetical protein
MKVFAGFMAIFAIGHMLLVAVGVGEGYVLHWLFPGLDLSVAIAVGTAFVLVTAYFAVQIVRLVTSYEVNRFMSQQTEEEEEEEEEEESEGFFRPRRPRGPRRRQRRRHRQTP